MLDSHLRPDLVGQRRARRAQPYANSSAASSSRTLNSSLSPVTRPGSSDQPETGRSSANSPSSGSSSGDRTPAPVSHTIALQRGSACLTCRRRKLKCDANKPACTSCVRTGRSQTCSYDDGLPKSRVQILTGKVRDLEEKILAMESARNGSPANPSRQEQLTPASSTDTLPYLPMMPTGDAVNPFDMFSAPEPAQDLDAWRSLATGTNGLVDLAATLAIPTQLPFPRQSALDNLQTLTPWWEQDEVPSGMQQHLLGIFLPRRWELGTEIDVSRLWASLSQPAAKQPHPCFLNGMYLVACSFSGDKTLEDLEPVFLAKTRKGMELSLVQGDRLIDFIRASSLLSFYYYSKGRLLEGHHLSSTTARFMIACGLHRMSAIRWRPQSEYGHIDIVDGGFPGGQNAILRDTDGPSLIPRPRDTIERNEYIHAFWQVYMQDLGGGLVTALPISVADSEITTSWPTPLTDDTFTIQSDYQTIIPLYSGTPGTADMSRDRHSQTLRIKTMCLLARAARLSSVMESTRYPDSTLRFKHEACEKAIAECMRTLPPEIEQLGFEGMVALLVARATLLAATIQLHASLSTTLATSREKALAAANESVEVLRRLRYVQVPGGILLLFGLDWAVVKGFYVTERMRLLAEGNSTMAETVDGYIQEITVEMSTVPARFSTIRALDVLVLATRGGLVNVAMSEEQPSDPVPFSYQPPLGGDVSLKSSDGTIFLAHSAFLALASPVFAGMFSAASKKDIVELEEDVESVSLMLRFIYPPAFLGDLSLPLLRKSLHMGQKYDIDGIFATADYIISRSFDENASLQLDPVQTFELASTYRLKTAQKVAGKFIGQLQGHEDVERLAKALPGHSSIVGLLGAQSVRTRALVELLTDPHPNLYAPSASSSWGSGVDQYMTMMCNECINRLVPSLEPGWPYYPAWLYCWYAIVLREVADKPLAECEHVFHISILHEISEHRSICRDCIEAAREAGGGDVFRTWAQEVKEEVKGVFASVESLYSL
ncbi:hypothetical protein FRC06_004640 [Ceratobasidium sp. 370]|nr:hypothetical protein FRC06_004640 [Ceratobasidium sp. 370]